MKFVELTQIGGELISFNFDRVESIHPTHYETVENNYIVEHDGTYVVTNSHGAYTVKEPYATVKKLLEGATTEIPRAYVDGVKAEENVFRMMSDKEYFLRFSDSVDNGDGKVMARAIIRMLYGMAYPDEEELEGAEE